MSSCHIPPIPAAIATLETLGFGVTEQAAIFGLKGDKCPNLPALQCKLAELAQTSEDLVTVADLIIAMACDVNSLVTISERPRWLGTPIRVLDGKSPRNLLLEGPAGLRRLDELVGKATGRY